MLNRIRRFISEQIVDDDKRMLVQFNVAYILFFSIELSMSVVDFFTGNIVLMIANLIFAVLCLFDFGLSRFGLKAASVANILFSIEIVLLYGFYLVTGLPEGFSVIWLCMLPSFGMILYRRSRTTVLCAIMFVVLVFFFWTPIGRSLLLYDYNRTFLLRFPILYVGFFFISFFLETYRIYTQRELKKARTQYERLYSHDELTGLFNRRGFVNSVNADIAKQKGKNYALALVDIDHFTDINGRFGHLKGDIVLKELAKLIGQNFDGPCSRWGDDKFAIFSSEGSITDKKLKEFIDLVNKHDFDKDEHRFQVTISVGCAFSSTESKPEELFKLANRSLYSAKTEGIGKSYFTHI